MEKGKATHSSISGLENSMDYVVHGVGFPVVSPALEAKPSRKGTLDRQLLWLKIIGL